MVPTETRPSTTPRGPFRKPLAVQHFDHRIEPLVAERAGIAGGIAFGRRGIDLGEIEFRLRGHDPSVRGREGANDHLTLVIGIIPIGIIGGCNGNQPVELQFVLWAILHDLTSFMAQCPCAAAPRFLPPVSAIAPP